MRAGDDDFVATDVALDANADAPTATIRGKLRDFFAASKGDKRAAQRLATTGDRAVAKKLVGALTGAMASTP